MKIVALKEHFLTPALRQAWSHLDPINEDPASSNQSSQPGVKDRIEDLGEQRIKQMDASGVDVQVLSLTTRAVQNLDPQEAVKIAQQTNDFAAETISRWSDRFEGFATLPTPDPQAAVRELERAITTLGLKGVMLCGRTRDRNLDHPDFIPMFERAADLCAPIYIHPQSPPLAVRELYYSGFGEKIDTVFASGGWGWHIETGIQTVRLLLSGIFDRCPDLQIILGHWGESMLFYLDHINTLSEVATNLKKPIANYVRENFYITPSGIFSPNYLKWSIEVIGAERIMFSD